MLGSRGIRRVVFLTAAALAAGGVPLAPALADGVDGNQVTGEDGAELVPDDICFNSAPGDPKVCREPLDAGRWAAELGGLSALHTQWRIELLSDRTGGRISLIECSYTVGASPESFCQTSGGPTTPGEGVEKVRITEGPVYSEGRIVFRLAAGGEVRATASGDTAAVVFTVSRLPDDPNDRGTIEL